jgi:hypothetical protein
MCNIIIGIISFVCGYILNSFSTIRNKLYTKHICEKWSKIIFNRMKWILTFIFYFTKSKGFGKRYVLNESLKKIMEQYRLFTDAVENKYKY